KLLIYQHFMVEAAGIEPVTMSFGRSRKTMKDDKKPYQIKAKCSSAITTLLSFVVLNCQQINPQ
ncbi:hypothetical protein, partial [Fluoribacter gormanii]|uniref:hypothetical protein n=1 Tax=Fluoribacter gormanii TaxID=464 RepID=UPI001A95023E